MPDVSANLSLPYLLASQAQKHVTHNEAVRQLDALVQLAVRSATQTAPGAAPEDGDRFVLPSGCTGDWAGQDGKLAVFNDPAWTFQVPNPGWSAWVEDTGKTVVFDGSDWIETPLQNLSFLGVNTTADATNRLAVMSPATLLTHEGAGHQLKVNKASAGDTSSLLFQTNWSGRAELGTAGSDNFELKVSSDGVTFNQAMVADAVTGIVSFPSGTSGLADSRLGSGSLTTVDYATAKGVDLFANGTGLLGNAYNFPNAFSFDAQNTPNLPGSFSFAGYYPGVVYSEEFLAVDPNQVYKFQTYLRQESLPGDWSAYASEERQQQFMGVVCYDADKFAISPLHHMRYKHGGTDSLTTLAAPLTPGDTSITLTNSDGWNESATAANYRGVIVFGYKNSSGFAYSHYSRLVQADLFDLGDVDKLTHVVTLNKPFPASLGNPDDGAGTWPVGTPIANTSSGGTYKYSFFAGGRVAQTDTWYKSVNHMGGIDRSGTNATANFPPGTAFVKVIWLPNYSNRAGGYGANPDTGAGHRVWFAGVSVTPETLAAKQEVAAGSSAGSIEIKVPAPDFAAGTLNLASAAQDVTEV